MLDLLLPLLSVFAQADAGSDAGKAITSIQWLGFALTEACFFYGLVAGLIAFFL